MTTTRLRLLTAGESHGPSLTGILEGMPAGLRLDEATIARDLARRQQGFGKGGRMALEQDRARITAGVMNGCTTRSLVLLVTVAMGSCSAGRARPPSRFGTTSGGWMTASQPVAWRAESGDVDAGHARLYSPAS